MTVEAMLVDVTLRVRVRIPNLQQKRPLRDPRLQLYARQLRKVFKSHYVTKHPWLVSDRTGKGAFCKFCKQCYSGSRGLPKGSDGTFIVKPFTKWKKATGKSAKNI